LQDELKEIRVQVQELTHQRVESDQPYCSPYLGPRSILVLDNASIHKSIRLRKLCAQYSVKLQFLPPYSSDFNPIEATFNDVKAWIRAYVAALFVEKV